VMWVTPTEEEIFKVRQTCHNKTLTMSDASQRYSPQLQKEALARRESTQQGFVDFTTQLKEASKSNKSSKPYPADVPRQLKPKCAYILIVTVWNAQKDIDAKRSDDAQQVRRMEYEASTAEIKKRQEEIRASTQ
jgi:hypothetical protein